MFKLKNIWDNTTIARHIIDSYNTAIPNNITKLTDNEGVLINNLIKQYTHTLQDLYVKFDYEGTALIYVENIISHNIVQLVNEFKIQWDLINFKEIGKTHNQATTRPYTDQDPNNVIIDNIAYTDINSIINVLEATKRNSKYLKAIYNELKTIVITMYEA